MISKTIVFSTPAYLSLRNGQIVIKRPIDPKGNIAGAAGSVSYETQSRPIEDVAIIILENPQITLTSALISALLENNCALITCNGKGLPIGLNLPLDCNSLQSERFKSQIQASLPLKKRLWQQTIQAKVYNQFIVLDKYKKGTFDCLRVWSGDVKSNDSENIEARAASFYWKNIFSDVSGLEDFTRNRYGDSRVMRKSPWQGYLKNHRAAIQNPIIGCIFAHGK